ncbi:nucleotide sugar dehydrogenase [Aeromicrobium sp. CTD01-1L150]|uniref:nucleotide sugar dehydrogenase n=1 Tax=Aeromicrobium sp. CTD01-1L150 TaxID=3341830 RepID=UPI0035C0A9F9
MNTVNTASTLSADPPRRPPNGTARTALPATPTPAPPAPENLFTHDVAVVGLGYVGLPTALAHHAAGHRVVALDVSGDRLADIAAGRADLISSDHDRLATTRASDDFLLTDDIATLSGARAVIICVPTPVDRYLVPDLQILRGACQMVVDQAVPGQLLLLTSTTYVGCTEELLVRPARRRALRAGKEIHVAFSAERIDPGSVSVAQEDVPRVVGGATAACTERAAEVLAGYATSVHAVPSLAVAEMTKLLENTFRAVNIALANEFADICSTLDIDVTEVIGAAATKPYGFMAFRPGPGVGGHCIPCDPHYLLWQLRATRVNAPMITTAMAQIADRPTRVVERVRTLLADQRTSLSGARILIVGVAYKPDVADVRESPALEILDRLAEAGAGIGYVDDHVEHLTLPSGRELVPVRDPGRFNPALVLVHTPHTGADLDWMRAGQLVLDVTYRSGAGNDRVSS